MYKALSKPPISLLTRLIMLALFLLMVFGLTLALSSPSFAQMEPRERIARGDTGLPLPRFVSLKNDKTYLRTGPGGQYPIQWVYMRKGLPLMITAEYGPWRQIRDWEGTKGWVLGILVSGKRRAQITGKTRTLYAKPDIKSIPVLKAEPTVLGDIRQCSNLWCQVAISGKTGWLPQATLWGTFEQEVVKK